MALRMSSAGTATPLYADAKDGRRMQQGLGGDGDGAGGLGGRDPCGVLRASMERLAKAVSKA